MTVTSPQPLVPDRAPSRIDVDFSLAIHNRTGKYFIGRDLLAELPDLIGRVHYARWPLAAPPAGLTGRVIGRLQHWHVVARTGTGPLYWLPPLPPTRRPMLHLDPFTVASTRLRRCDAVLCHDVGPLTHPELFPPDICVAYRFVYREIARIGPHMIFVSESSRIAFQALFPAADPASVHVIYPPLRSEMLRSTQTSVAGLDSPFLLTVGTIGARKNQARCIEAFARSGLAALGVRYVICGGREPGHEIAEAAAETTEGVVLLPYVSDTELAWLYGRARGFVLASLLEGFGIPVAEAIGSGLVPAVSRDSVLEEVAGPGAIMIDPKDEENIATAMIGLVLMGREEHDQRMGLLDRAIERFSLARFTDGWRAALRTILQVA